MKWEKKGLIFKTEGNKSWSKTHTTHPIPLEIDNDVLRIFYTTRDFDQRSRISYIDVSKYDFKNILYKHQSPIFELGELGTYDDRGLTCSFVLKKDDENYFYTTGYNTANTARYRVAIGLAKSNSGDNFAKYTNGPIMDRSIYSPCGVATPYIIFEEGLYKMWYTSFYKWEMINNIPEPFYNIRYATSKDALNWNLHKNICVELMPDEGGIVRPSIIKNNNEYFMLFSVRKKTNYREGKINSYKIGLARSSDGINWKRDDTNVGITKSETGWDSEMQSYPFAFKMGTKYYLLYNGNGFGMSGLGYAELKSF